MRIMAKINSDMEKDIQIAQSFVNEINDCLSDIQKVLNFKKNSALRVAELQSKKQECIEKLNSIQNTLNVQRLYKYELKDELSHAKTFDLSSKLKFAKKVHEIKELRRDIKDMRARTLDDLRECERLLERRKSIRVHENLSSYVLTLVGALAQSINNYREFRKDFYDYHGLTLPAINLCDCIQRTEGKEIELTDFKLPHFIFVPFVDENSDTENICHTDEIECFDF